MEDETTLHLDCDHELMCTENREFLYDNDRSLIAMNTEPTDLQNTGSKMAPGSKPHCETNTAQIPEKQPSAARKSRKRNPLRDRLRNEAEQNAYQHLRRMIPSLQTVKKPTKLETIRNACEYIESLQKTIVELEGELGFV